MYVCVKCNVKTMISRIWLNPRKMLVSSINYPYIYKIFFVRPSREEFKRYQCEPNVGIHQSFICQRWIIQRPQTLRCSTSLICHPSLFSISVYQWTFVAMKNIFRQSVAMMHSHVLEQLIEITRLFLSSPS